MKAELSARIAFYTEFSASKGTGMSAAGSLGSKGSLAGKSSRDDLAQAGEAAVKDIVSAKEGISIFSRPDANIMATAPKDSHVKSIQQTSPTGEKSSVESLAKPAKEASSTSSLPDLSAKKSSSIELKRPTDSGSQAADSPAIAREVKNEIVAAEPQKELAAARDQARQSPVKATPQAAIPAIPSAPITKSIISATISSASNSSTVPTPPKFGAASTNKCPTCSKTVYAMEELNYDGKVFHKGCLKCAQCNCSITLKNIACLEGQYYCKPHFKQLFKLKGNYAEGFGKEDHKKQWS